MREIPVARGRYIALVDDADAETVSRFTWYMQDGYARTSTRDPSTGKSRPVYMHRLIMAPPKGLVVDHIDDDRLNNQRANLRICTGGQNVARAASRARKHASEYRGVYPSGKSRWSYRIVCNGTRHEVFGFPTARDAAIARDAKSRELRGAFAFVHASLATQGAAA